MTWDGKDRRASNEVLDAIGRMERRVTDKIDEVKRDFKKHSADEPGSTHYQLKEELYGRVTTAEKRLSWFSGVGAAVAFIWSLVVGLVLWVVGKGQS